MARTALVLSAGGMFGAYQAGAWKALAHRLRPDLVVGASVGALNGWAIAGGCDPRDLVETWLNLEQLSQHRLRAPRRLGDGWVDSRAGHALIQSMHARYRPCIEYGAVVTDSWRLRPRVVRGPSLTWQHLAASAAIPWIFDQHRIDGRLCCDGGLLNALPLWAAVEMGAERIVAVNVLSETNVLLRNCVRVLRAVSRFRPSIPESVEVIQIAPRRLGSVGDAMYWKRENAARWIEQGKADAERVCSSSLPIRDEVHA